MGGWAYAWRASGFGRLAREAEGLVLRKALGVPLSALSSFVRRVNANGAVTVIHSKDKIYDVMSPFLELRDTNPLILHVAHETVPRCFGCGDRDEGRPSTIRASQVINNINYLHSVADESTAARDVALPSTL